MIRTKKVTRSKTGNKSIQKGGWSTVSVYDPNKHPDLAERFSLLGYTNQELADRLAIKISTLEYWMRTKEEFATAVRRGREDSMLDVVGQLQQSALGFYVDVQKVVVCKKKHYDENGNVISEQTYPEKIWVKEYIKPETINQRYILNNRTRHLSMPWGDNQNVTVSGPNGGPIQHQVLQTNVDLSKHLDITELQFIRQIQEKMKEVQDD